MFIITDTIQFPSITNEIIPFQSGSVFCQRAQLTAAQCIYNEWSYNNVLLHSSPKVIIL